LKRNFSAFSQKIDIDLVTLPHDEKNYFIGYIYNWGAFGFFPNGEQAV
jgi:hypothetical protein